MSEKRLAAFSPPASWLTCSQLRRPSTTPLRLCSVELCRFRYYAYDSLNRLTNVTDWAGRKTVMVYDLASRVTSITRPNGTVRTIGYDAAGQTTNIVEKAANGNVIVFFKQGWDNAARMQWEFGAPLPHSTGLPTRNMTFDDDNRLVNIDGQSVMNDLDGNMTNGPISSGTLGAYTYDTRNRLTSAGGLSYTYDPAGNRTAVTNGATVTKFVINPNAKLSQVLTRIQNSVTNYYIYGGGLQYQVTEMASATNTLTYHYDYRGSTVAISDANGNVTDRIEYSAYGNTTYRAGTNDTPFLFNARDGVRTDANGLLYMRARYYNPFVCRFLNPDPSVFSGGLNFFAYANGNPVSYIDPFGLQTGNAYSMIGCGGSGFGDFATPSGVSSLAGAGAAGANVSQIVNHDPSTWFADGMQVYQHTAIVGLAFIPAVDGAYLSGGILWNSFVTGETISTASIVVNAVSLGVNSYTAGTLGTRSVVTHTGGLFTGSPYWNNAIGPIEDTALSFTTEPGYGGFAALVSNLINWTVQGSNLGENKVNALINSAFTPNAAANTGTSPTGKPAH